LNYDREITTETAKKLIFQSKWPTVANIRPISCKGQLAIRAQSKYNIRMNLFVRVAKTCSTRTGPALLLGLLLSACGREDIRSYRVPKEAKPTPGQAGLPAGHPDISAGAAGAAPTAAPRLSWTKPEGWNEAAPGQMRVAAFNVKSDTGKQADVSVIPLPGTAGGELANVNRWRGQVGLAAVAAEELTKTAEAVEIARQPAKLFEVAGKASGSGDPTRILGVIQQRDGMAWFFKMTGEDALVAKEKAAFVAWLKSVKFETPEAATGLPDGQPAIATTPNPNLATAPTAPASEGKPKWEVPADWKEIPGGQFLVAKFILTGEAGAQAAVNVSKSAGEGGGLEANVNRWRKQLGLTALTAAELKQQAKEIPAANGGTATFVEMSGTDGRTSQPASLAGAVVVQAGQAWFYKLMGDAKVVEEQKAAFTKFVLTVKY